MTAGNHSVNRNTDNTFSVTYHYQGPGSTQGNTPTTGTIELKLVPYTATLGPATTPWVQTVLTTAPQFNMDTKVDMLFKLADRPADWTTWENAHGPITFVCGFVTLKGFTHDDDPSNDGLHANLNYFSTSEFAQKFAVTGNDIPGLKPGQVGELFLRFASLNDPSGDRPVRKRDGIGTNRWTITNAHQLGLTPVRGDPTLFSMCVYQGKAYDLALRWVGQPLPYKTQRSTFNPATPDGKPNVLKLPVRQGQAVTVMGFGEIDVDGNGPLPPTSATGLVLPEVIIFEDRQPEKAAQARH